MRPHPRFILGVIAFGALALACASSGGRGSGTDGGSDDGPVTAQNFEQKIGDALCGLVTRCSPGLKHAACDSADAVEDFSSLPADVAAGRIGFDAATAQACLDDLATLPCSGPGEGIGAEPATCDALTVPKVPPGGDCYQDTECVGGYCELSACPGRCVTYAATGASCASATCAPSDFCSDTQVCTPRQANGSPCNGADECVSFNCDFTVGNGTCAAMTGGTGTAGASCTYTGDCAAGFFCHVDASGDGTCTAFLQKGDPCGDSSATTDDEGLTACGPSLVCAGFYVTLDPSTSDETPHPGTCAEWSDLNESCTKVPADASNGTSGCMYDLACGDDGKCGPPPGDGQPCSPEADARCDVDSYCSGGECASLSGTVSCQSAAECAGGQSCVGGLCVACHP